MPKLLYRTRLPKPDSPRILRAIYDSVRRGHPLATAAARARISPHTIQDWARQGEADLETGQGQTPAELGSHALFAWTLKQAEARMVEDGLRIIDADTQAAPVGKRWVPAITKLERRRPQDFGRRDRQDVHIEQRTVVLNLEGTLPPEALLAAGQYLIAQAQLALPEGEENADAS